MRFVRLTAAPRPFFAACSSHLSTLSGKTLTAFRSDAYTAAVRVLQQEHLVVVKSAYQIKPFLKTLASRWVPNKQGGR